MSRLSKGCEVIFATISDIHGNSAALDAVLADIDRRGIESVVNLGDSLSGPLDPAGTARRLMACDFPTVSGNHDRGLLIEPAESQGLWERWTYPEIDAQVLDWLRGQPAEMHWRDGVYLCHGSPRGESDNWLHDRDGQGGMRPRPLADIEARAGSVPARLLLSGHTHMPRMVRLPDGRICVNPGAVGLPAYADHRPPVPTAAMAGAPDARYAICEEVAGDWRISLVTVPYDPSEMIARARSKGAHDWAEHLATGWAHL